MKTFKFAITYEFENAAPLCTRGEATATQPATAAARALRQAKKTHKGARPKSIVILLEEKDSEG